MLRCQKFFCTLTEEFDVGKSQKPTLAHVDNDNKIYLSCNNQASSATEGSHDLRDTSLFSVF